MKRSITKNLINIPGWRTNRKILIIESDDWGSIRMPSLNVYRSLLEKGYAVNQNKYEKYDSLASAEDLSMLFEVLSKHKDCNNYQPIITANTIVGNPDFDKIRTSGFKEYHFEWFTDTLKKYDKCGNSFDIWKQGIKSHIFKPQFHGREHVNVDAWMKALQMGDKDVICAFDNEMTGLCPKEKPEIGNQYMKAYDCPSDKVETIVDEGLSVFEKIFGYKSSTFIAPCYIWPPEIEKLLQKKGINSFQGIFYQYVYNGKRRYHWLGSKNKYNQSFLLRNCFFEPAMNLTNDPVDHCLYRIQCAFRWKKPATISSHRLNYIGRIHPYNRDRSLSLLDKLLKEVIKKWPDIEFMSSDQLSNLLHKTS